MGSNPIPGAITEPRGFVEYLTREKSGHGWQGDEIPAHLIGIEYGQRATDHMDDLANEQRPIILPLVPTYRMPEGAPI
jgi:hypothetical protein